LVCATRVGEDAFYRETALGRSLAANYRDLPFLETVLFADNRQGLPALYNQAIRDAASRPAVLVFVHDDIDLVDFYWPDRLYGALLDFQVVGVVGNRRRLPRQPSWCFKDEWLAWDDFDHLSGFIGHGDAAAWHVMRFGIVGAACKLLDGVFLAADSALLLQHQLQFDERFDFHFYDLDFCRQAEAKGVRMGTAPICLVHHSTGQTRSAAWRAAYQAYVEKWGD
jgi:hypothetical protein